MMAWPCPDVEPLSKAEIADVSTRKPFKLGKGESLNDPNVLKKVIEHYWHMHRADYLQARVCAYYQWHYVPEKIDDGIMKGAIAAGKKHQIPPAFLLTLGMLETKLNRQQGSNGLEDPAWGMMQFMGATLKEYEKSPADIIDTTGTDDAKIALQFDLAGAIMRKNINRYGNIPAYSLAQYNGGFGKAWPRKWPTNIDDVYSYVYPGQQVEYIIDLRGKKGNPWDQNCVYVNAGKIIYQNLIEASYEAKGVK